MRTIVSLVAVLFAAIGSVAAAAEPLRVCFDDHDAPRSDEQAAKGFDLDLMGLVGERIGRPLEPVWVASDPRLTDIDESDLPLKQLSRRECDAVASVPGEAALRGSHGTLALTRPYYGVGFELVGPPGLPDALASLKGRKISVQSASVAHLAAVRLGLDWTGQTTAEAQLEALDAGRAQAALVWGPDLGPLGRKPKAGFTPPAALRWNEHVATRRTDEALRAAIDGALADLVAGGKVDELLVKYGMPPHAPFDTVFSQLELAAIQSRRK